MKASDIPNIITVFRFLLVPPVVVLLLNRSFGSALVVFGVAGVSDAIDGFLAKHFHWTSRAGALMDPLADKLLLVCSFVTLGFLELIPTWLVGLVILRDLVIISGALTYHFYIEQLTAEPTLISKLNTLAQILLVLVVLFSSWLGALPGLLPDVLMYCVAATTLSSGADYVWTWSRRAWRRRHS